MHPKRPVGHNIYSRTPYQGLANLYRPKWFLKSTGRNNELKKFQIIRGKEMNGRIKRTIITTMFAVVGLMSADLVIGNASDCNSLSFLYNANYISSHHCLAK